MPRYSEDGGAPMATAAVIIIGNEILSGKFADENGPYLIKRLRRIGVELCRICVIPDVAETIAAEVALCSASFDHVFTTGGVGPTHDDLTFESVAAGLGVAVETRSELVAFLDHYEMAHTPENLRMCTIPEGAELLKGEVAGFPIIRARNVFILPGVPRLVKQKFEVIAPMIASEEVQCVRIYARDRETEVAAAISAVDAAHPTVQIGSYPRWGDDSHRLIVTVETRDAGALAAPVAELQAALDVVTVEGP